MVALKPQVRLEKPRLPSTLLAARVASTVLARLASHGGAVRFVVF